MMGAVKSIIPSFSKFVKCNNFENYLLIFILLKNWILMLTYFYIRLTNNLA